MIQDLSTLYLRDLATLRREIALYPDDATPWQLLPGMPNSGGTLTLHLAGNLRHFIGATLGGTGYVRDRESEFSWRNLSRTQLVELIDETRAELEKTLQKLDPAMLDATYPLELAGRKLTTRLFLFHLLDHLALHLGQLDYHRRVVTGSPASAGIVPLAELGDPV